MSYFKHLFFLCTFLCTSSLLFSQLSESKFSIDPVLTPDAETIIFSNEGDLWRVPVEGGQATRLTAMDGEETRPNVSPDGKWLAFTGTQYGNKDVFLMPLNGGEIKQLTFHQAGDDVDSWSWDSKTIYFTSSRYNRHSGYAIEVDGGTPKRLFDHYFDNAHNIAVHPKTNEIYFNETWESKGFAHRKRYKGDYNPDIKSYNPKNGALKVYTTYNGKDFGTTIDKKGKVYFMSDEANGEYNLYTFNKGKKQQLTKFETSVYWPKVSANGNKVVFRKDYDVYVYDVEKQKTVKPEIRLFKNYTLNKVEEHNVKGKINNFAVAPDNKKMAFVSRGRLFISDIKGKYVKEIATDTKQAVGEVVWLKDNKTLLFTQTVGGYYNLFSVAANGSGKVKQHTSDYHNNRNIVVNSDRSKAVYLGGRNEVRLMDLETMNSETIAREELWGLYNPNPYFSPDDRYIAFNAYRDFERDIFVYDLEKKSLQNLTKTRVSETAPFWSPDGKYMYFASDLLQPTYPYGTQNTHIYRLMLDKYEDPFKLAKLDELFEEEEEEEEKEKEKKDEKEEDKSDEKEDEVEEKAKGKDKDKKEKVKVNINTSGLMDRISRIGPSFGQQGNPYVIQKDGKTFVFYTSNHDEGDGYLWKTTLEAFEKPKTEKASKEKMSGYGIEKAEDKYYITFGGNVYTFDPSGNKMEKIDINHTFRKSLSDEFEQMYYEAWAGMEENFYNETFHGQDWQALRDQYAALLPYIANRAQLRLIFNDMLGELNTSHFGFYSNGKEEKTYYGFQTTATGILFEEDAPFTVKRIVKESPADVKDKDIKPGDVLVAVNGDPVDPARNREMYFSNPSRDQEIALTFDRNGTKVDVKLHTTSYYAINTLLYDEWQDANQAYVDQKSNNRIAYVHMKNMGRGEFNKFKRDIIEEGAYKDALIVDLRYNTGGNVHDDVLRLLSQRTYLQWKYREGELTGQSNFGPSDKPIVLLINEQSLSDAEMTAQGFKELGLGKIIGTETYRWIIFTSGKGLVDGSFYRLPSWGCYTLDGKNLEQTGVAPDIRVEETFKDRIDGNQPQLDRAIQEIKKLLK
jgi:tricorn protease